MWTPNMPGRRVLSALAFSGIVVVGCAQPPSAEVAAADAALGAAVNTGAEEYAPAALGSARDLRAQLDAELVAQSGKWAVTRSYDRAAELAGQVKTAAETAALEAETAREKVRQETAALLDEVKVALQEVQAMLASAPRGKGTAADLAALQADLDSAAAALVEGEGAFAQGRFMEAKGKVFSVQAGVQSVRAALEAARQVRDGR